MAEKLSQRIYNISGERPISYKEFVEAVKRVVPETHLSLEPGHGPGHRPNGYMDITRIKEELGYQPEYERLSWSGRIHPMAAEVSGIAIESFN